MLLANFRVVRVGAYEGYLASLLHDGFQLIADVSHESRYDRS